MSHLRGGEAGGGSREGGGEAAVVMLGVATPRTASLPQVSHPKGRQLGHYRPLFPPSVEAYTTRLSVDPGILNNKTLSDSTRNTENTKYPPPPLENFKYSQTSKSRQTRIQIYVRKTLLVVPIRCFVLVLQ